MRVDFYQLGGKSVSEAVTDLCSAARQRDARVLVVAADNALTDRISTALWAKPDSFLAHGRAGGPDDARQPILLSDQVAATNGAKFLMLADGHWREGELFDRVFHIFDAETLQMARDCWRDLGHREGVERHFWKQDGKKWVEAG